jgi:hypothetical protein
VATAAMAAMTTWLPTTVPAACCTAGPSDGRARPSGLLLQSAGASVARFVMFGGGTFVVDVAFDDGGGGRQAMADCSADSFPDCVATAGLRPATDAAVFVAAVLVCTTSAVRCSVVRGSTA